MVIYTSNKEEWKAALLELVDADQLPKSYGGKMSDDKVSEFYEFAITKSFSIWLLQLHRAGDIPHSYYLSNNEPVARDNFESLSVSAGSKKQVKCQVDVVNSILRSVLFVFKLNLIYKKKEINNVKMSLPVGSL